MKIALVGPTLTSACRSSLGLRLEGAPPGVAQTPIAPLAAQLRNRGHEVHIVTCDPTVDSTQTFQEEDFSISFCPLRGEPRYRARTRAADLFEREIRSLREAIVAIGPDVVHAHWTYEFAEAALRSRHPHLVTMHDLGWDYFWQFRDAYRFMRLIMKYRTMPRVKRLSVVSPFMAGKAWHYGYFGKVDVIPNGIEIPRGYITRPDEDLERPNIVTVGNPGNIKNVQSSIEAFRILRKRLPLAKLHLFGPGLTPEYSGSDPGVFAHGNRPHGELMDFLASTATILVHPSRLETFGVVIAEAKARGVPVVAGGRSGGVGFVCDDGVSKLVDVTRPDEIASAMSEILSSPQTYHVAQEVSFADAATRFGSNSIVDMYEKCYAECVR